MNVNEIKGKDLRREARGALAGNWKPAILATALYFALTSLILLLPFSIGMLASLITMAVIGYNYSIYNYDIALGRVEDPTRVCNFDNFGKKLGLFWYITLFTFLWSLLLLIPGIIAAIRYSQAFYVLKEHPEYSVPDCVNESKRIMADKKWKYFKLNLSFIGWFMLVCLVCGLVLAGITTAFNIETVTSNVTAFNPAPKITTITGITESGGVQMESLGMTYLYYALNMIIVSLGLLPLMPYQTTAMGVFYKHAKEEK